MSEIIIKYESTDFKVIRDNENLLKSTREEIATAFGVPKHILEKPNERLDAKTKK